MYKDLLKKMFCELALEYEKEIEKVAPHLDAKYLALLETKDLAIKLLVAKTHQYDKLVEKIKEIIDRQDDSYISSMLEESQRYCEIKELMIKELENE